MNSLDFGAYAAPVNSKTVNSKTVNSKTVSQSSVVQSHIHCPLMTDSLLTVRFTQS